MSELKFAGNVIIPGTITITADNSHITPLDDLRVILNIAGASTVTLDDGTDTTQRVVVLNKSSDDCVLSYKDAGGTVSVTLGTNRSARFLWVGTYYKAIISGIITGTDINGNPVNCQNEATVDTHIEPQQYTTTEQITGKYWTDGKPIYRKVITAIEPTVADGGTNTAHNIANMDLIVDLRGMVDLGTGVFLPINMPAHSAQYAQSQADRTNVTLITNIPGIFGKTARVILEYTKTTD